MTFKGERTAFICLNLEYRYTYSAKGRVGHTGMAIGKSRGRRAEILRDFPGRIFEGERLKEPLFLWLYNWV